MKEKENVKKCCLISLIKSENYGANLQGFALYYFIRETFQTLDVVVVDLLRPGQKGYRLTKGEISISQFRQKISSFIFNLRSFRAHRLREKRFRLFLQDIVFTPTYHCVAELFAHYPKCDIYITGSDQVWCPDRDFDISPYLLEFVKHPADKISYAPSMSTTSLSPDTALSFISALSGFKHISVREISDYNLLTPLLPQKNISVVADPVLLLTSDYWEKITESVPAKDYVLLYTIGPDSLLLRYALEYCERKHLKLYFFRPQTNKTFRSRYYRSINDAGPREMLGWIKSAKLVITTSYHGILMSLLLRTPVLFYASKYTTRFDTIVNLLRLEKHYLTSFDYFPEIDSLVISEETKVAIEKIARESREYLTSAINDCL